MQNTRTPTFRMPRYDQQADGFAKAACKIRKRGSLSASSSSTLMQNHRFTRAILVAKRGSSSTPVPLWKINARSPSSSTCSSELSQYQLVGNARKGGEAYVSARKLANALWEMNGVPAPQVTEELQYYTSHKEMKARNKTGRYCERNSVPHSLSDLLHNSPTSEADTCSRGYGTPSAKRSKSQLKDIRRRLRATKELIQVLTQTCGLAQKHSTSCTSLVSGLHSELDRALVQIDLLVQEQRYCNVEVNCHKCQSLGEKLAWTIKGQEGIKTASNPMMEELELEKKLRKKTERLNKKLGVELASMKSLLSNVNKDLENEKRSREIIEQVCNELVREIGEDKAAAEELKKESIKVREELQKEREMLQLADIWREERVHMKLLEAKYHYEEKNAAVEQLRNELEVFLKANRMNETSATANKLEVRDHEVIVGNLNKDSIKNEENERQLEEEGEVEEEAEDNGEDSTDSDLHSIELNMDSKSRHYCWSYAAGADNNESKFWPGVEIKDGEDVKPEKSSKGSFPFDRALLESQWSFCEDLQKPWFELNQARICDGDGFTESHKVELDEDVQRYLSVKGLRETMLAGARFTSASVEVMLKGLVMDQR